MKHPRQENDLSDVKSWPPDVEANHKLTDESVPALYKNQFHKQNIIAKRLSGFHFNNVIIQPVGVLSQDESYRVSQV